ncbi:SCO2584 family spore wall biosynthesis protein [Streptomyces fuscigenes]|uniref:SCO2584 family spore wall biosynthesis protein n=1 Tax=Streptomyces fuscigenes TaxID=1528880 RepID=UPI001F30D32F|nr:hypothetical protein [Streptomyces fuscigenes]MCF3964418.1 hypothetical protein [Streptomyces fuscigenes]
MPDDVGGRPFKDGREPDDDRGANEEFATVVFDEDFVRAAAFHEPTAVERLLAAAQARAEAEAARARGGRPAPDEEHELWDELYSRRHPDECDDDARDPYAPHPYGPHGGVLRPYRGRARWHRPVAWLLAVLMGVGMVALAFSAVRGASGGGRQDQVPQPASTGIDAPRGNSSGGTDARRPDEGDRDARDRLAPPVSAVPRTP